MSTGFPGGSDNKESACTMQKTQVQSLGRDHPLEEGMATHCSILAWRIPWTKELGWLQSIESTEYIVYSRRELDMIE